MFGAFLFGLSWAAGAMLGVVLGLMLLILIVVGAVAIIFR
jgi:hypothetical protein